MPQALNFIIEKCTGCHQCELACSGVHTGVFNQDLSRIRIFQLHDEGKNVPYACLQCAEAWCLHACPVEAIYENAENGAKVLVDDVCVGCKVCTIACPYGTVVYHPSSGKVVKCDMCEGFDEGPYCVASCPTSAIEVVDLPAREAGL